MSAFFAMNGYGFYIWMAYGVAALMLVVEVLSLRSRGKAVRTQARLASPDAPDESQGVLE